MQTLEKEVENTTVRRKRSEKNSEKKSVGKKSKGKIILKTILGIIITGILIGLFLLYGPITKFREWYITSAMTTMTHQYLATWFYSDETINDVLSKNKVVEVDGITDTNQINTDNESKEEADLSNLNEYERAVLEKDKNHPEYKLINIDGKGYSGYLAVIYDASKIHTLVSSNLGKTGQYVTTMAEKNKAVLAINGGGFEDENHNSAGGVPLGITISKGKILTKSSYSGPGGLIGFDEDDKLVLGKVSVAQAQKMNIRDAVTCGPFLILNGQSSEVLGNGGWGTAPRTAIGQRKDGVVLLLVIDGRKVGRAGAQMNDLIEIMERYGAYNAAALDGGTSSVMVENYKIINDPINSDGVHKTRPVATAWGLILDDSSSSTSNSQTTTKNNTTNSGKKIK